MKVTLNVKIIFHYSSMELIIVNNTPCIKKATHFIQNLWNLLKSENSLDFVTFFLPRARFIVILCIKMAISIFTMIF